MVEPGIVKMIVSIIALVWLLCSTTAIKVPVTLTEVTTPTIKFNSAVYSMISHPGDSQLLVITDQFAVWTFDPNTKQKTLVAGSTSRGYQEGIAENARFDDPVGLAHFNDSSIIVTDEDHYCVRLVNLETRWTERYAGVCKSRGYKDGNRLTAQFGWVWGITRIGNDFYICDVDSQRLRRLSGNMVSTVTSVTNLNLGLTSAGNKLFYTLSHGLGEFDLDSRTSRTLTGTTSPGSTDGGLDSAQFRNPFDVVSLTDTVFLVADTFNTAVRIADLNKKNVSSIIVSASPYSLLLHNGDILVGIEGGKIEKFPIKQLPEMSNMQRRVELQAEYPVRCSTLKSVSFSVINSQLLVHTKYLQKYCPVCQLDASPNPEVTCTNDTLISTWITGISGDNQVLSENIKNKLHTALAKVQNKSFGMEITVISTLPRIVSPLKDSSGLNLRVIVTTTCLDKGFIYNKQYDVCELAI